MRVLLVDDHAIVRRGLMGVIRDELGDVEFGEAGTPADALALADGGAWDLAIIDLSLPQRGGLDLLRDLKARAPALPVLVVSMQDEREYGVRVMRAGAAGFVAKTAAPDELPKAIRIALAGGVYASPATAGELVASLGGQRPELSDRELQVLRMIGSGKSVKQIAGELALSEKTVSTYRTRILDKLGLAGTAELIRYAIEHGLV